MAWVKLIGWPFDLGRFDFGMGKGPLALLRDEGFMAAVGEHASELAVEQIEPVDEALPELVRIFELDRRLAATVARAVQDEQFPLILAGNCISCLGTVAGISGKARLGVVWLDAHADFDTPEDNLSGFSDVMGLSILTGGSWRALRDTIPGFVAVDETDVVLLGARDLAPYQRDRLCASQIHVVDGHIDPGERDGALGQLAERVQEIYLHVDLDVLDTSVGSANRYAAPGGPGLDAVRGAITKIFATLRVRAASITAYDPTGDLDRRILEASRQIAGAITKAAQDQVEDHPSIMRGPGKR